ncbi:Aste57867_9986 [Aphanomyces stellatus]|uniref:Aste57867_9986 protein n=1 Tax=Aphanomyces stellatus TaxID=120398 RepID=A0A485KP86_9STRA|nr:hypothetical protein As57867_009947 [Aphanomyces stellatus]VFT86864.1 Aste57867_9986 [Aphanomyces stellatus]
MTMYNKVDNQGALMGNWVEEEALRHDTGNSRYQTWTPKEGMGVTHPRVVLHTDSIDPKDYHASSKMNSFDELTTATTTMGPRERRRLDELHAQAKAIKESKQGNNDADTVKESQHQASYKAYDPAYVANGVVRVPPRGKGGFKEFDASIVGKTRGQVAAMDAAKLAAHQDALPQQKTVTRYSHAGLEFPLTAAAESRNPFGKSSTFTNDIFDAKVCRVNIYSRKRVTWAQVVHGESSYPGAESIVGIGMNIQTKAALLKIKQWTQAPEKRRDVLRLCHSTNDQVSLRDFSFGLHEVGLALPDRDLQQVFVYLDKDHVNSITWAQFQALLE